MHENAKWHDNVPITASDVEWTFNNILKKDGYLIITTPNFKYSYKIFYDDPTHVHPYTPKSLVKILEMNNF